MPSGVIPVYIRILHGNLAHSPEAPRMTQRGGLTTAADNPTLIAVHPSVRVLSSAKKQKLPFCPVIHALLPRKTCPLRHQKPAFVKTGFYLWQVQ